MSRLEAASVETSLRDRQILARIVRGEPAAIAELYDCYGRLVFSLVVHILGDAAVAEDVVQDVFTRVWQAAGTYRPEGASVRAWLLAIAHHRSVDEWRRRRKEIGWVSLDEFGQEDLVAVDNDPTDPLVQRAMQALPAEQRLAVEMAYFQGLTMLEIAARLELPPGTVKSRIRLAMDKLRAQLGVDREGDE